MEGGITGKGFVKGDPRCWRKGKPKEFNALRDLAQEIAQEKAKRDGQTIIIDGHSATVSEMILRTWATSKNPILAKGFLEIAFGKVPDEVNVGFNFAKMTDAQLTKFIEGALAAIGAGLDGGTAAGPASPVTTDDGDLPVIHPPG